MDTLIQLNSLVIEACDLVRMGQSCTHELTKAYGLKLITFYGSYNQFEIQRSIFSALVRNMLVQNGESTGQASIFVNKIMEDTFGKDSAYMAVASKRLKYEKGCVSFSHLYICYKSKYAIWRPYTLDDDTFLCDQDKPIIQGASPEANINVHIPENKLEGCYFSAILFQLYLSLHLYL